MLESTATNWEIGSRTCPKSNGTGRSEEPATFHKEEVPKDILFVAYLSFDDSVHVSYFHMHIPLIMWDIDQMQSIQQCGHR